MVRPIWPAGGCSKHAVRCSDRCAIMSTRRIFRLISVRRHSRTETAHGRMRRCYVQMPMRSVIERTANTRNRPNSVRMRKGIAVVRSSARHAPQRPKKVLAVASGGGHWVQMKRLMPVLASHEVTFVTVSEAYRCDVGGARLYAVTDATAWNKFKILWQAFQVLTIVLRIRPDVVVSTGAAPGYFAIRFAKLIGARTIWIDSIANVERLSLSGVKVRPYADLWLTQWQHLTLQCGPWYKGAVL